MLGSMGRPDEPCSHIIVKSKERGGSEEAMPQETKSKCPSKGTYHAFKIPRGLVS